MSRLTVDEWSLSISAPFGRVSAVCCIWNVLYPPWSRTQHIIQNRLDRDRDIALMAQDLVHRQQKYTP